MVKASGNYVYSSKYFSVEEDLKSLSNGKQVKYSTVHRKPISVVFPLTDRNELCLISQYRRLFEQNIIEAAAGHADDGEDPLSTAKRELKEETGITANKWKKINDYYSSASVIDSHNTLFLASEITIGHSSPEAGEDIEVIKLSISDAVGMIYSGEIKTASTIIGILMINNMQKEGLL